MDRDFQLAVDGQWDALLAALRENRELAHKADITGMTLLHWVCLHQTVPTEVLIKTVFANPNAVHARNGAGHMPIDLALEAKCDVRIIDVLRAAEARHQFIEEEEEEDDEDDERQPVHHNGRAHHNAPSNHTVPSHQASLSHHTSQSSMTASNDQMMGMRKNSNSFLEEDEYDEMPPMNANMPRGRPGNAPQLGGNDRTQQQQPLFAVRSGLNATKPRPTDPHSKSMSAIMGERFDAMQEGRMNSSSDFDGPTDSQSEAPLRMRDTSTSADWRSKSAKNTFPPRWKQARSCNVCMHHFSLTKRRHHCRNCGNSVCAQHSHQRVTLPKFDLFQPQRVCDRCFLAGRHLSHIGNASIDFESIQADSTVSAPRQMFDV